MISATLRRTVLVAAIALALFAGGSSFVVAGEPKRLSGEEIAALVGDTTISGTMLPDVPYKEYYGADGMIKGTTADGPYTGKWSVDGDTMCFDYGDPATVSCWAIAAENDMVQWIDKDGNVGGTGMVVKGNPDNL